jgi:hypothetical protein
VENNWGKAPVSASYNNGLANGHIQSSRRTDRHAIEAPFETTSEASMQSCGLPPVGRRNGA